MQGLNKGESRNYLAEELGYARHGTFREGDPEMRLSAASCLNLVILCTAISNTVQMQKNIRQMIKGGMKISKEDARFLSPYLFGHLNFYGQFNFLPVPEFDSQFVEREILPLKWIFLANCLPKKLRFSIPREKVLAPVKKGAKVAGRKGARLE